MSNYRMMRIGLLIAVIVGGLIFHHQGHAYETIRIVYVVIVVGFLIWRISMRTGRIRRNRNPGPPPNHPSEDYRDR